MDISAAAKATLGVGARWRSTHHGSLELMPARKHSSYLTCVIIDCSAQTSEVVGRNGPDCRARGVGKSDAMREDGNICKLGGSSVCKSVTGLCRQFATN